MSLISRMIRKIKIQLLSNEQYIKYLRKTGAMIGNGCSISKDSVFGTEPYLVTIGNNVRITSGVKFFTHDGGFWVLRNMGIADSKAEKFGRIIVGDNVNIGWNVMILPGVKIGNNVIIGCGAIVTKDVPDNSVVAGVPAKVIETIEQYSEKNKERILLTKGMAYEEKRHCITKNL